MGRKVRTTDKRNIVIVCEGSDTEPSYLEDLCKKAAHRFDNIRIVPFGNESKLSVLRTHNAAQAKNGRKRRKLIYNSSASSGNFYWVKEEEDDALYEKYKAQPTRYVREAQLFMEDGYVEGWAVYDHDKFPNHKEARTLADSVPNLNIAFSSISFEEWMLLHFERNPKPFDCSCCKENQKEVGCGLAETEPDKNCHGERCLIGYLREKQYIPDYSKSKKDLFSSFTMPRINIARVNAAWIKTISDDKTIYNRNPYCDFDALVERLLGLEDRYFWIGDASEMVIDRCKISITREMQTPSIKLTNTGNRTLITNFTELDKLANPLAEDKRIVLNPEESTCIQIGDGLYLCLGDGLNKYIITI